MTKPTIVFDKVCKRYELSARSDTLKEALINTARRYLPMGKSAQSQKALTDKTFWALKDVSFEIQPGEAVGIIGPNGSGKSTSLKILSGVTKPTSGRYELNGRLGALLEVGAGFHPDLTGRENVYMNGSILGMSKKEIDRKFDSIVDFSELEKFIDTPVKHYSSGMYVRLGFSVAIHNEPEVMLVDEALAVGDMGFQKKCFNKIHEIIKSGRTFVLVSHAMNQIQETCSRAILINKGNLVADGNPLEITEKYIALNGGPREIPSANDNSNAKVIVRKVRLIDDNGNYTSTLATNAAFNIEIEYITAEPIHNPAITLKILRGPTAIYQVNTHRLGVDIGTLNGQGILRCSIEAIPLTPNSFDIDVIVLDEIGGTVIGYSRTKEAVTTVPPEDLMSLGGYLAPEKLERPIVYGRIEWNNSRGQS